MTTAERGAVVASGIGRTTALLIGTVTGAIFSKKGSEPTSKEQDAVARERDERRELEKAELRARRASKDRQSR